MCPPSPQVSNSDDNDSAETKSKQKEKVLKRMNSFHVGPVKLPHPVKIPNGRATRSSNEQRAGSADYSLKSTTDYNLKASNTPKGNAGKKGLRSFSLKYGSTLDDDSVMEKIPVVSTSSIMSANAAATFYPAPSSAQEKIPKVKTVPLYRPKRSSDPRMSSAGSCHIAIEEMTSNRSSGNLD